MRIGIDCRLAGVQHAGIGRYIENLLTHVLKETDRTWVLFFAHESQAQEVLGKSRSLPHVEVIITPVRHYTLAEQVRMPVFYWRAHLDLLHVPHFNLPLAYRGRCIVTIHDLLWHEQRGSSVTTLHPLQYWVKYLFYKQVVRSAVSRAQLVLVPARTVQQTVEQLYPNTVGKIVVTKEGARQLVQSTRKRIQAHPSKTLLYVGSLYPHKNVRLILDSLAQLSGYTLKIIGARSVFQDATKVLAERSGVSERVEFAGFVPDTQLAAEYERAFALVQPSLSEGFGLTGVEAMSLGTPVLASDIPIFREIYQDAAVFFDPRDPNSFVSAVHTLEQPAARTQLRARGIRCAQTYNWDRMAQETLAAYQRALPSSHA